MISFAVTAYNEMAEGRKCGQLILNCIRAAMQHPAIGEVVVVDDGSEDFGKLLRMLTDKPKVRLFDNVHNLGVFGNKLEAIAQCSGEWVITCDSDNVMDETFINDLVGIIETEKEPRTWYCPSFARTHFDYRGLVGKYTLGNVAEMMAEPMAACCLNTGNQTVHREQFMKVFGWYRQERADLIMPNWLDLTPEQRPMKYWRLVFDACDSFIFNMEWFLSGGTMHVVEGMEYDHYYAGGPESNYNRAPQEKGRLGEVLFEELRRRSEAL